MNMGKIVGCIIGTKVARYDIFGQDVLISRLIEKDGLPGAVRVSESFRKLMARKSFIYDTFDWQEYKRVSVPDTEGVVQTYTSEQIFAELDSYSEADDMEPQMSNPMNKGSQEVSKQAGTSDQNERQA
mmetsp:Transcript_34051/g.44944  ORF Transcript_34051/g.44944 Transcript_34051/m.44944 type:complete len:128 (-) Transcript_34051:334-717(-)